MFNYSNTKVTMELRDVLASTDENGKPFKLWDFDTHLWLPHAAQDFISIPDIEKMVIDRYYFRQIGFETIERFHHYFRAKTREIVPYYNRLFKTVEIMDSIDDPFGNVDVTETFEQTSTGSSSGSESGTTSNNSRETAHKTDEKSASDNNEHRFSNTPQGSISNIDTYLTEASRDNKTASENVTSTGNVTVENTGTVSNTGTSESSGTIKHTLTKKGNQGVNTYAHDMVEYRTVIINHIKMFIDEYQDLFLKVY